METTPSWFSSAGSSGFVRVVWVGGGPGPSGGEGVVSSSLLNSGMPHPMHMYVPVSFVFRYSPVNGRSVPASLATWYWMGVSFSRHSSVAGIEIVACGVPASVVLSFLSPARRLATPGAGSCT